MIVHIRLQYYGMLREAANKAEEELALPGEINLYQLLEYLETTYGSDFGAEIFTADSPVLSQIAERPLRSDLMVMFNDKAVAHGSIASVVLQSGDRVALFPLFPGGG